MSRSPQLMMWMNPDDGSSTCLTGPRSSCYCRVLHVPNIPYIAVYLACVMFIYFMTVLNILLVQEILLPLEHLKQLTRSCQTHVHQNLKTYFKNVPYQSSFNECNGISDMNYLQKGGNLLITQLWKSSSSDFR